ncbi:MAG: hypothetical protein ACOH2J_06625 [Allorhizobium sp.]
MKRYLLAACMFILPALAFAEDGNQATDPTYPVKVLIDMAAHNAAISPDDQNAVYQDYFDPGMLLMYYSQSFTAGVVDALMNQKRGYSQMLLDHDAIVGGQDGCPLKNIRYSTGKETKAVIPVKVTFEAFYCLSTEAWAKKPVDVMFDIKREGPDVESMVYYVDDIHHTAEDGTVESLKELFGLLAKE